MLGYPPTPPRGARRLTAQPADPQGLGQPRGGEGSPPPPYSPPNCRTPLGVTHWLAAAPVKRHHNEHRPQRPSEHHDPTQHMKGRTGDCPGPRKETGTRWNVTHGGVVLNSFAMFAFQAVYCHRCWCCL